MGIFYSGPQKNNYCKVLKPNGTLLPRQIHVSENVCSSLESLKNIVLFLAALSPPAHPPSSSPPKQALFKAVPSDFIFTELSPFTAAW